MSEAERSDEPPESMQGRKVAQYRTVKRLGDGGMGVVYLAEDTKLKRTVALKVIKPEVVNDKERRKRFIREGRLAAAITHPCIATVYEVGEADSCIFIAMEYVEGESLGDLLASDGPMPVARALRIIREVTRGLVKAHEVGIIHRDLKPENVMVGADQIVKILDFGVAKRTHDLGDDVTDVKTKQGSLIGTPAYMSPEQAAGRPIDARSDIFSVGVLLYELLTGKRPFGGETWQETIISVARDQEKPITSLRRDVSEELQQTLSRCMAKSPDDRHPNARALLDDLDRLFLAVADDRRVRASVISSGSMTDAPSISTLPPERPPSEDSITSAPLAEATAQQRAFGWPVAGLLAVALAVGVWSAFSDDEVAPPAPAPGATPEIPTSSPTAEILPSTVTTPSTTASTTPVDSASSGPSARPATPSRSAAAAVPKPPPPAASASSKHNPLLGF